MNCITHLKKTLWLGMGGHFLVAFGLVCSSWGQTITNIPPAVAILRPPNGAVYYTPVNIQLLARAGDLDGRVTNVDFFANGTDLGAGTMVVLDPPGIGGVVGPVYLLAWSNIPPSNYALTAVATDNGGASTTSATVNISVLQGPPPPPTNAPIVRITSPPNGA
ncbi:MAG: Ig-like domain-containing protein, partial [Limisphaerales bacterium]